MHTAVAFLQEVEEEGRGMDLHTGEGREGGDGSDGEVLCQEQASEDTPSTEDTQKKEE